MLSLKNLTLLGTIIFASISCGKKEGKDGEDSLKSTIEIIKIKDSNTTLCPNGFGGIQIVSFVDDNENKKADEGEKIIDSYIKCYIDNSTNP